MSQYTTEIDKKYINGKNKVWVFRSKVSLEWMDQINWKTIINKSFYDINLSIKTEVDYLSTYYITRKGNDSTFCGVINNKYEIFESKIKSQYSKNVSMFFIMPKMGNKIFFPDMLDDLGDEKSKLHELIGKMKKDTDFGKDYEYLTNWEVRIPCLKVNKTNKINLKDRSSTNRGISDNITHIEENFYASESMIISIAFEIYKPETDVNNGEECVKNSKNTLCKMYFNSPFVYGLTYNGRIVTIGLYNGEK